MPFYGFFEEERIFLHAEARTTEPAFRAAGIIDVKDIVILAFKRDAFKRAKCIADGVFVDIKSCAVISP